MHIRGPHLAALLLTWVSAVNAQPAATFQGLGLHDGQHWTYADAVSDVGPVVAGSTNINEFSGYVTTKGIVWTPASGLTAPHPGRVVGISADGERIAGQWISQAGIGSGTFPDEYLAFWGPTAGPISMFAPDPEQFTYCTGLSADGNSLVGFAGRPFKWSPGIGTTWLTSPTEYPARPRGVSGDGRIIVGYVVAYPPYDEEAVMWRDGVFRRMGGAPGGHPTSSNAAAVSRDGTVTVGWVIVDSSQRAARAYGTGPFRPLPLFPGYLHSEATATNADGNVVIGWSTATHLHARDGFIWTRSAGMRNLKQRLLQWGAPEVADWTSLRPRAISGDGRFIVGTGRNPLGHDESWLATIPPFCYANCDNSTTPPILNVDDFTCFINRFANNDPYANCDNSTIAPILNVDDFTCFINLFAAGCPE